MVLTVYFEFISRHYIYIFQVGLILTGIGIIGIAIYLPESPLWLLKQGKVDKAVKIMERIMIQVNKNPDDGSIKDMIYQKH